MRCMKTCLATILTLLLSNSLSPVSRQARAEIVYSVDFSQDPGWVTDDPSRLAWDQATQTFHGTQINTQGTYAYKYVSGFDPNQSWRLEVDTKINSAGWSAGLTFGLFDGSLKLYGGLMDQSIVDAGFVTSVYGDTAAAWTNSPAWQFNVWYHNVLEYDAAAHKLFLSVADRSSGAVLWNLSIVVQSFHADTKYLGVSRAHMKNPQGADPWASVDYNLDNITLSQVPEPSSLVFWLGLGALGAMRASYRLRRVGKGGWPE